MRARREFWKGDCGHVLAPSWGKSLAAPWEDLWEDEV